MAYDYMMPRLVGKARLFAPMGFWLLKENDLEQYGCGAGKFGDKFVPDTMWFLDISKACQIHDYMYSKGVDDEDKWTADVSFLTNLNAIIESESNFVMRPLRRARAMTYFSAVRDFGKAAFYKGKELNFGR